jgi:endonuclease IV
MIGLDGLKEFIKLGLYHKIPIILETPDGYVEEIKMITKLRNL